jgi:hypothetical protein
LGQQPNVPLEIEDLPRATPHPGPARRWVPDRPGDLNEPGEVPQGGGFGAPGPDAGYALRLIESRSLPGEPRQQADVKAAVAAVVTARAAALGRAPVGGDIDAAILLLGLPRRIAELRGIAHDRGRLRLVAGAIDRTRLSLPLDQLSG